MTDEPASTRMLSYPMLVGDIGGTNARFGILPDQHADLIAFDYVQTADHADVISAIEAAVLAKTVHLPKSAVIAAAGVVAGDAIALTNCDWTIEPRAMIERIGLIDVVALNDFEAVSLALPYLGDDDLIALGGGSATANGTKVALGPGTGLGVAGLVHSDDLWIPIASEGGHISLGPESESDLWFWPHIARLEGRVTGETLLSGPGLVTLHRAVAKAHGVEPLFADPSAIPDAARAGDSIAQETMAIFCRLLGRFAGDIAVTFLPRGGVYLAGGIPMKILDLLEASEFRAAFEAKAPHREIVSEVPTYVIRHPRPAFVGVSAYARMPRRFGLQLDGRRWLAQ